MSTVEEAKAEKGGEILEERTMRQEERAEDRRQRREEREKDRKMRQEERAEDRKQTQEVLGAVLAAIKAHTQEVEVSNQAMVQINQALEKVRQAEALSQEAWAQCKSSLKLNEMMVESLVVRRRWDFLITASLFAVTISLICYLFLPAWPKVMPT
jgi:small-conductance mechanosensitive channel